VQRTIFLLKCAGSFYIVHCNIEIREAKMATATKSDVNAAKARKAKAAIVETQAIQGDNTMTDTVKDIQETMTKAASEATEKATSFAQNAGVKIKEALGKTGETAKEVFEFNKANAEAVVESGKIAAKAAQQVAEQNVALVRKNWETGSAHVKALAAVKSPTDFFKLQADFTKSQADAAVSEFSKATEFATKMFGEIVAPLQNRYAVASEQVKTRFAA
jgi:phasin family protein